MSKQENIINAIDGIASVSLSVGVNGTVHFVPGMFDTLVHDHGLLMEHHIAVPCPQSSNNISNIRSNHADHNCSNGFYYSCAGTFTGLITNAPKSNVWRPEGLMDSASGYMIVPRFYEGTNDIIYFGPYDRIFIADDEFKQILVPTFEHMQASAVGVDRLRFPAVKVTHILDKDGNPSYKCGQDFKLTAEGNLEWISQNRPQYNPTLNEGGVYSVRYLYTPYYYVAEVLHEIRVSKIASPDDDGHVQIRLPMYLRTVREKYFRDQANTEEDANREGYVPPSGANLSWR